MENENGSGSEYKKDDIKGKVVKGTAWLFVEKAGIGVLEFVVAWVLARFFLVPGDYAAVGICSIFIVFANLFSQGSFNIALIRKKDLTDRDLSTVFWLSFVVSTVLYFALFFAAPLIARFYGNQSLVEIMRIQGLCLIFDSLATVHTALLTREMKFNKIFAKTAVAAVMSGGVGILSAALGLGVYALVFQAVILSLVSCVMLRYLSGWRPGFAFSGKSVRDMASFSSAMLSSNVLNNVYSNALPLAMEKVFVPDTLGYYNKSRTIPSKIGEAINSTISGIAFPSLSAYQSEPPKAKELLRKFICVSSFVMFAAMAGLIAVAEPMILLIYSEKWAGSIVFMRFVCVPIAFLPVDSANLQTVKAFGKGGTYLILEIVKNVIGIAAVASAIALTYGKPYSLYAVLAAQIVVSLLCVFINAFPNKKIIGYTFGELLKDILPSLCLAAVMGVAVFCVTLLGLGNLLTLLIQVPLGLAIYIGGAALFRPEGFKILLAFIKNRKKGKTV